MSAEPMTWEIRSYSGDDLPDGGTAIEWAVDDAEGRELCIGIQTRELAEDIAALPLLKQFATRVPIQTADSGPLISAANSLIEVLRVLQHIKSDLADARGTSISSCEVKFLANGTPQPTIKAYAGSEVPVEEAIEAYGRTMLMATQAHAEGWEQTVDVLQRERQDRLNGGGK